MDKINLLMISFHFPPIVGSSGYLRALKFAKFLPQFSINPFVLTAHVRAYPKIAEQNYRLLDQCQKASITRAQAFDSSRHLALFGKYPEIFAIPDKWVSWSFFGENTGKKLIKEHKIDAIWCTYPIASALKLGLALHQKTGLPLFTDLRDPIWEEETWVGSRKQHYLKELEQQVLNSSQQVIFTSPGTITKYKQRYPGQFDDKYQLLLNGYDEDDYRPLKPRSEDTATDESSATAQGKHRKLVFLHSGLLPKYERDPSDFFQALSQLKKDGVLNATQHIIRFRGCGHESLYQTQIDQLGIADLIDFQPPCSYGEALQEQLYADFLVVFQAATCNWQIPAKIYEYLRAERPIIALTPEDSDTAWLLKENGVSPDAIAPLDDAATIASVIQKAVSKTSLRTKNSLENLSREKQSEVLAGILQQKLKAFR